MTTLSTVKSINKRVNAIYAYFGPRSVEYMRVKSIMYSNLGQMDILLREADNMPLIVSRSKKALNAYKNQKAEEAIRQAWEALKQLGTVNKLRKEYTFRDPTVEYEEDDPEVIDYDDPEVIALIQETSETALKSSYIDDDIYEKAHEELEDQLSLLPDEQDKIYIRGLGRILDILKEKGVSDENKRTRAWALFTDIKLDHEEWLAKKAMEGEGEHDLGGND